MNRSWGADPPVGRPRQAAAPSEAGATVTPLPGLVDPAAAALTSPQHFGLADELAPMVQVWERLLALHLPDRTGRCRTCTQGGTGLPGTHWPCALHGIAELARRRHGRAQGA
ncbi:hypothetical protein [Pseudonocardia broussonetiae]|uniref:hypothetical protein n=1 Tax=Pseudonocardia broussonetiae TaxID=2736640 RepID=UPI001F035CCD|nr:hypothetical protein [Pseudonocardia broussonetiae]